MVIAPALDAEPFDSSTVPTVPAMGASSSALSRSSCAACSACSACSSLALADATWAALTVAVVVDELLDEPDLVLDEPDVYMHPDLQRRLIRFLLRRDQQVIVATHSIEMMSEVEPGVCLPLATRQA